MEIEFADFLKVQLHVGTIIEVSEFPEARKPAYKLRIDFGPLGIRKSSAQITKRYRPEDLTGTQIIAVTNFPSKQIGRFMSECLVLGATGPDADVVLIRPDAKVPNGTRIA